MLAEGQLVNVFVTHVEATGKTVLVWAQIDQHEGNQLEALMTEVQNRASIMSALHINDLEPGEVCLALYQEDEKW